MKTYIHLFTSRRFVALRLRLTGLAILSPLMTAPTQYYLLEFTWTRTRPSSPGTDPVRDWDFLFFSPYSLSSVVKKTKKQTHSFTLLKSLDQCLVWCYVKTFAQRVVKSWFASVLPVLHHRRHHLIHLQLLTTQAAYRGRRAQATSKGAESWATAEA